MTSRFVPGVALALLFAGCSSTVAGGGNDADDDGQGGAGGEGSGGDVEKERNPEPASTGGQVAPGDGDEGGSGGGGGGGGGDVDDSACDVPATRELEDFCSSEESWPECTDDDEDGVATWQCATDTPLVLSFDGAEPTFPASDLVGFDLSGLGQSIASDWPAAATPWLALDRDGDGAIGGGSELFGSAVRLASGRMASHGFAALAELDGNQDGKIDASDPRFGELRVWADANADRATTAGELTSAASGERRIVSIDLGYHVRTACDARGNCGIERASFVWADRGGAEHVGEVVDVHLPRRMD